MHGFQIYSDYREYLNHALFSIKSSWADSQVRLIIKPNVLESHSIFRHQGDDDEVGLGNAGFYISSNAAVCKRKHY